MATLRTGAIAHYLTSTDERWRPEDHRAHKLVQIIKGRPINGYVDLGPKGDRKRYTAQNQEKAVEAILRAMARCLTQRAPRGGVLIPIPNSNGTIRNSDFRTFDLAKRLAKLSGPRFSCCGSLRWRTKKEPASKAGGYRDPDVFYENLKVVEVPESPAILFDDVITTGSQMQAAYRRLEEVDRIPLCAIACGRTTKVQHPKPIEFSIEELTIRSEPDWPF